MPELTTLISFLAASIGLTLLPGPDNLFVLSISALNGAKAGIPTAIGMAIGNFAHSFIVAIGVGAIIAQSPGAIALIKILGILYLLTLAWQSWQHPIALRIEANPIARTSQSAYGLFKRGFLMNLLNPKVALFFLAFFPQFINPELENSFAQTMLLGTLFVIQAAIIFTGIAILAERLQPLVLKFSERKIALLTSALFLALACLLVLSFIV